MRLLLSHLALRTLFLSMATMSKAVDQSTNLENGVDISSSAVSDIHDTIFVKGEIDPFTSQKAMSTLNSFDDRIRRMSAICDNPSWTQIGDDFVGADYDRLGSSVAISQDGTIMAMSSPDSDGYVRLVQRGVGPNAGWSEIGLILGNSNDRLGWSIDLAQNGNMVAISAIGVNSYTGVARVFVKDDTSTTAPVGWSQVGNDLFGNGADHIFGESIAISEDGTILIVGAYKSVGYVKVFERDTSEPSGWRQIGSDVGTDTNLGFSVAISADGTTIAAGNPHYRNGQSDQGMSRAYVRNGDGWLQTGQFFGPEKTDHHGWSVALNHNGTIWAIGEARGGTTGEFGSEGAVYIYERNPASVDGWDQIGGKIYGNAYRDWFGYDVDLSLDGNTVVIGAEYDHSRYVKVFQKDASSTYSRNVGWSPVGTTIYSTADHSIHTFSRYGKSVAISGNGNVIAVGAPGNYNNGIVENNKIQGHVQVLEACDSTLTAVPSDVPTIAPFASPSAVPSLVPTSEPTAAPTLDPFSWDIDLDTPGYLKDPPIQDGVQQFITNFNISDRDYEVELFETDCLTASTGLSLLNTIDSKSDGKNHIEAIFLYNQSVVQASSLWSSNTTGGDADFCVKLSLYTNSSGGILFNFIETIYKIEVDLVTGFSTQVDVVRTAAGDGGVETIDAEENITVYQCNDTYDEVESPSALTQGDALQICVETEDDSVFEVAQIKDVTVDQNGTKTFDYVTIFVDSYWAQSSCQAVGTRASVCKVKMQLLGDYFEDADPTDLTVSGFVKMDYLGRRRGRRLLSGGEEEEDMKRSLQEITGSKFTLTVPVSAGGEDDAATNEEDTGTPMGMEADDSGVEDGMVYLGVLSLWMAGVVGYTMMG